LKWRSAILALLAVAWLAGGLSAATVAQETPTVGTFSQFLRSQGFSLTDEEVAFLDADERSQASFAQALVNLQMLAAIDPAARPTGWRDALLGEMNRIISLNPEQTPPAPTRLQRLRELGVAQRAHVVAAVRQWLQAFEAGAEEWWLQGSTDMEAAREAMASWQQELIARFPPPQQ
jgi:hypothetical protein